MTHLAVFRRMRARYRLGPDGDQLAARGLSGAKLVPASDSWRSPGRSAHSRHSARSKCRASPRAASIAVAARLHASRRQNASECIGAGRIHVVSGPEDTGVYRGFPSGRLRAIAVAETPGIVRSESRSSWKIGNRRIRDMRLHGSNCLNISRSLLKPAPYHRPSRVPGTPKPKCHP